MTVESMEIQKARIRARKFWVDTGIDVVKHNWYSLQTNGHWWDLWNKSSAEGYGSKLLERSRKYWRDPTAPLFALIGAINKTDPLIPLYRYLDGTSWAPDESGRLWCFANDAKYKAFYLNNWGSIELILQDLG